MTVIKIVAETKSFVLIRNKNQLTSYAGYDVIQDKSGNHNGKQKKVVHRFVVLCICLHLQLLNTIKVLSNFI